MYPTLTVTALLQEMTVNPLLSPTEQSPGGKEGTIKAEILPMASVPSSSYG